MKRLKTFWEKWGYACVLAMCALLIGITAVLTRTPQREAEAPQVTRYAAPTPAPQAAVSAEAEAPVPEPARFLMPCDGEIGMRFAQEAPVYNETLGEYAAHDGVDILAKEDDAVRAMEDGVVTRVWEEALMGHCIEITHRGGYISTYASLYSAGLTEQGAAVSRGQVIGLVGTSAVTECAAGPHVHVELRRTRMLLDPEKYFAEISE